MTSQTQIQAQTLEEVRNNLFSIKNELEKIALETERLSDIARDLVNALLATDEEERRRLIAYATRDLTRFAELDPIVFSTEVNIRASIYDIAKIDLLNMSVKIYEGNVYKAVATLMKNRIETMTKLINKVREEINKAIEALEKKEDTEEI